MCIKSVRCNGIWIASFIFGIKFKWKNYIFLQIKFFFLLGIEFYLFVSHSGMKDRGSTCKFVMREAKLRLSSFGNLSVIHSWV